MIHEFTFIITPSDLTYNIENILKEKVYSIINTNNHFSFGIVKSIKSILPYEVGTISYQTINSKFKVKVELDVITPINNTVYDTTVNEVTDSGFFCNDESNTMNIFVVCNNKFNIGDKVKIKLIKCKFTDNKWTLIGSVII